MIEISERITIEDYDLNPYPLDKKTLAGDLDLVHTRSGELVRILERPNYDIVRHQLQELRDEGHDSLAISFMHAYLFPDHEDYVARIAEEVGFKFITTSAQSSPTIKFLDRSQSICTEAYLYPLVR